MHIVFVKTNHPQPEGRPALHSTYLRSFTILKITPLQGRSAVTFTPIHLSPKWQMIMGTLLTLPRFVPHTYSSYLKLSDGDTIKLTTSTPCHDKKQPIIVLFHGLSGDERSSYMTRIARKIIKLGHIVIRVNHRGANKQLLPLAKQVYHAGKSSDIYEILLHISKKYQNKCIIPIGFSLSGNMLLKALGEHQTAWHPIRIKKAIAIAPPLDLGPSIKKLSQQPFFDRRFAKKIYTLYKKRASIHNQLNQFHKRTKHLPSRYGVYEIDNSITALEAGYTHAKAYYKASSAKEYLAKINIDTHILCDHHDPFIDNGFLHQRHFPNLKIEWTHQGGHMGYLGRSNDWKPFEFWLDKKIIAMIRFC